MDQSYHNSIRVISWISQSTELNFGMSISTHTWLSFWCHWKIINTMLQVTSVIVRWRDICEFDDNVTFFMYCFLSCLLPKNDHIPADGFWTSYLIDNQGNTLLIYQATGLIEYWGWKPSWSKLRTFNSSGRIHRANLGIFFPIWRLRLVSQ